VHGGIAVVRFRDTRHNIDATPAFVDEGGLPDVQTYSSPSKCALRAHPPRCPEPSPGSVGEARRQRALAGSRSLGKNRSFVTVPRA